MGTFSALLALCQGNPSVTDGFPSQRARNAGLAVFFDAILNKQLSKQSSVGDLRRHGGHCEVIVMGNIIITHVHGFFDTDFHEVNWHLGQVGSKINWESEDRCQRTHSQWVFSFDPTF